MQIQNVTSSGRRPGHTDQVPPTPATVNCPRCGNPVSVDDEWTSMDHYYPMRSVVVAWHTPCAQEVVDGIARVRSWGLTVPRKSKPAPTPPELAPKCSVCGETDHPEGTCLL